ncbi:MAG: hypothetical protein BGN88_13440 [Clostridiales bacterium 43-6]|nr:MAG: hypothetical protein BGN88_13440 [Clostridiales bacterium 43-6]
MPNNELICICQCGGTSEPAPENRVYVFHSTDNGEHWTEPVSIYPENGKAVYCTEVFVLNNVIHAFLTTHSGHFLDWECILMISRDNGYTWENSGPPPHFPSFTFIRGMITLKNSNILIPYQFYPVIKEANDRVFKEKGAEGRVEHCNVPYVENGVLISSDSGNSYDRFPAVRFDMEDWIWSEPTIAELSNGTVTMLLRKCGSGYLWRSNSTDGGKTWSEAVKTDIPNPTNKPKLIAIPDGRIALIHTPNNKGIETARYVHRYPLQIWISDDNMNTFRYQKTMTEDPGNYSYADGFYENGHILFTIEKNRKEILFIDHIIE